MWAAMPAAEPAIEGPRYRHRTQLGFNVRLLIVAMSLALWTAIAFAIRVVVT